MEVILAQAKERLIPIGQWNAAYPTREDFVSDMARGECYVLICGDQVGGFFTLSAQPEESYCAITDGKWSSDEPYATLHRCAVARQWYGSGLSDHMIAQAKELTLAMGRPLAPGGHPQEKQVYAGPPAPQRIPVPGQRTGHRQRRP